MTGISCLHRKQCIETRFPSDLAVRSGQHQEEAGGLRSSAPASVSDYFVFITCSAKNPFAFLVGYALWEIRKTMIGYVNLFPIYPGWLHVVLQANLQLLYLWFQHLYNWRSYTSVTQIRGAGLKRERGQQRGRFTSHVVKSMLASSDCARKGEHDPRPSVFLGELRRRAALCSL